jgi:hypothetical protein
MEKQANGGERESGKERNMRTKEKAVKQNFPNGRYNIGLRLLLLKLPPHWKAIETPRLTPSRNVNL